jgi:hypothetical protein
MCKYPGTEQVNHSNVFGRSKTWLPIGKEKQLYSSVELGPESIVSPIEKRIHCNPIIQQHETGLMEHQLRVVPGCEKWSVI